MTETAHQPQPQPDPDPLAGIDLLPDLARAPGPWSQLLRDMTAPAPMSIWASEVTTTRVKRYDRIRPYLTRAVLLAAVALLLGLAPGTIWATWVLLLPALAQVVLEILIDLRLNTRPRGRPDALDRIADITDSAHNVTLVNVTGLLGALAVPANLVAVCYLSGPGEPAWAKVVALALAVAYGNSGILSFLTDAAHYSANQAQTRAYRVFLVVRPHTWLLAALVLTGIVAGSVWAHRWAPAMVPLAWALCLGPAGIGMKQRDYERFLRAGSELLPEIARSAKRELAKDYHNANTDLRVFNRRLAANLSLPADIRVRAAELAPMISLMTEAVDHEQWVRQQQRPSLAGFARKYGSDASLNLVIDLDLDDLTPTNYDRARALLSALLINVGQAMVTATTNGSAPADDRVYVSGQVRAGQVQLCVRDPLPLITDWCREGSTTRWLHEDLIANGGAGLSQHPVDGRGKEIRASWPAKKPPAKLRERN